MLFPLQVPHWDKSIVDELQQLRAQMGLADVVAGRMLTQKQLELMEPYLGELRKRARYQLGLLKADTENLNVIIERNERHQERYQALVAASAEAEQLRAFRSTLRPDEAEDMDSYLDSIGESVSELNNEHRLATQTSSARDLWSWRVERHQTRLDAIVREIVLCSGLIDGVAR